jgi:hypothetical protein
MATPDLTPDEFASWLTPPAAVKILESAFGTDSRSYIARHTLLERLRGGRVRAVAKEFVVDTGLPTERAIIDPDSWIHMREEDIFWTSGDLTFSTVDASRRRENHRFYHVRFEAAAIHEIAGNTGLPATIAPSEDEKNKKKLPNVSEAALAAWHEAYQKAYGGTPEDKLATAFESAVGMFPGKFVSRQKIRDLVGGNRKPGPKGSAK